MKSAHKVLRLHHHKHTGKVIAHKHTSYRVLFLLMLLPVMMLTLVDRLNVAASDLFVNAKVMAGLPAGVPMITSPQDGDTMLNANITASGSCPTYNPAPIVTLYNNGNFAGSTPCTPEGTFSIPILLSYGTNALIPKLISITDEVGDPGPTVTVTLPSSISHPATGGAGLPGLEGVNAIGLPLRIVPIDMFALVVADGSVSWRGSIVGGSAPYTIHMDWGDGTNSTTKIGDSSEQIFTHRYDKVGMYDITIVVTDNDGSTVSMHIAGITRFVQTGVAGLDTNLQQLPPPIAFIQKYVVQIYIVTLSSLIFLWYLEHGRHVVSASTKIYKRKLRH